MDVIFKIEIVKITIAAIKLVRIIFITENVPMQVPKSFPSDILLTWAAPKPRSVEKLNVAINEKVKAMIPSASGAYPPQSFTIRINSIQPIIPTIELDVNISNDFLAIMFK